MANIIVAFSKPEDAKSIKNILMRNGFPVIAVCTSGAQVLSQLDDLNSGIIVCGYRLTDMLYSELHDCMSPEFSMLMISSPSKWSAGTPEQVVCLPMPLKVHDLVGTLEMIVQAQARRRKKLRQQQMKERAIIKSGEGPSYGAQQHDRGRGPVQHGQRDQYAGDGPSYANVLRMPAVPTTG